MKLTIIIFFLTFGISKSQINTFQFENLPKQVDKPILIYLKTNWCSICKHQIHQIEKDKNLQQLINETVYLIIFDAETTTKPITILDKTFTYINNGNSGIHELALYFSKSKQAIYPTWIMLDIGYKIKFYHQGFLSTIEIKNLLKN